MEFRLISNFVAVVTKTRIIRICSKQKTIVFSQEEERISPILLQKMIRSTVTIKLYCFKLFLEKHFCLNNRPLVFQ